jgi:hypothetical protein
MYCQVWVRATHRNDAAQATIFAVFLSTRSAPSAMTKAFSPNAMPQSSYGAAPPAVVQYTRRACRIGSRSALLTAGG